MFFVSFLTSACIGFLPETTGKALGNFGVSFQKEQDKDKDEETTNQQAQGLSNRVNNPPSSTIASPGRRENATTSATDGRLLSTSLEII